MIPGTRLAAVAAAGSRNFISVGELWWLHQLLPSLKTEEKMGAGSEKGKKGKTAKTKAGGEILCSLW